ncbi:MAG: hypothetical protein M0Z62_04260 [Actinomycetota bacterium]|nr:hypothetical protein [Actinomycetota bacterium]
MADNSSGIEGGALLHAGRRALVALGTVRTDVVLVVLAVMGSIIAFKLGIDLCTLTAHQRAYPQFADGISTSRREFGMAYGLIAALIGPATMTGVGLALRHTSLSRRQWLALMGLVGTVVSAIAAASLGAPRFTG